jgi:hypothetical protein
MMKNDVSNKEFINKRTQNIKYILLKELRYDNDVLKIEITPYILKGSVDEISFRFYLDTMCDPDLSDICLISKTLTERIERFFDKFGFNNEYQFVGNPNPRDYNLMGPMNSYLMYSIENEGLKMDVEYIYETSRVE